MKIIHLPVMLLLAFSSNYAMSGQEVSAELKAQREQVVHQYILDLGKADHKDIIALFMEGGTVISTSRGTVNAQEFFASFLPAIETANTEFHQSFISNNDTNHYGARFRFQFNLYDGEQGDGEYIDEFVFADNSAKLTQVYMFENLKFNYS